MSILEATQKCYGGHTENINLSAPSSQGNKRVGATRTNIHCYLGHLTQKGPLAMVSLIKSDIRQLYNTDEATERT